VPRPPRDDEDWLAQLESDDEILVVSALHAACPCRGPARRYEEYMDLLHRFQKDPRPRVRKVALHLEYDAFEELTKDDERAAGWQRNRPGGNGRRGEHRKDAIAW
jgi:hypothetical protein